VHRRFALPFLFVLVGIVAVAAPACSDQGEGERCTYAPDGSGNDDCKKGLICTAAGSLPSHPNSDVCCPPLGAGWSTDVCNRQASSTLDASLPTEDSGPDTSVPTEAGDASDAAETGSNDGGGDANDAQTDAPVDAPADAPVDAADDGG